MSPALEPEFDRILRVVNEDSDLPDGVEDRIWERVTQRRTVRRRSLVIRAVAGAAAAVVVVLAALTLTTDDDDSLGVATDGATGEVDLEPCEAFRSEGRSPQTLRTLLLADAVEPGELGESADAVDELRDALGAAGRLTSDAIDTDLSTIAGALRQADASLRAGDREAALRALDFAAGRYERNDLAATSCLG